MSAIDLVILGIVLERPRSAYEIQKDVESHHLSRWTKISAPSVYKKVLQLRDRGYLKSEPVRGQKFAEKAEYSLTRQGEAYFKEQMQACAKQRVPLLFDFNVVVANLNKLPREEALTLIKTLRASLSASAGDCARYAAQYPDIPLTGRTIFDQQALLYQALLDWLDGFERKLEAQP